MFKVIIFVVVISSFIRPVYATMAVFDSQAAIDRSKSGVWERTQREREYIEFTNQTTQLTKSVATGRIGRILRWKV